MTIITKPKREDPEAKNVEDEKKTNEEKKEEKKARRKREAEDNVANATEERKNHKPVSLHDGTVELLISHFNKIKENFT